MKVASLLFAFLLRMEIPKKGWVEVKSYLFSAAMGSSMATRGSWVDNLHVDETKTMGLSPVWAAYLGCGSQNQIDPHLILLLWVSGHNEWRCLNPNPSLLSEGQWDRRFLQNLCLAAKSQIMWFFFFFNCWKISGHMKKELESHTQQWSFNS